MADIDDITITKGLDWSRTLTVTYPEGHASEGQGRDLTGATISAQIRRYSDDASPLITLTVGSGITLASQSGATLGQATLFLASATHASLANANHVISVYVTPSGESVPQVVIDRQKLPVVPS